MANAEESLNKRGWDDSKRQVLGLNLAAYHINEGLHSTEPGDDN